MPIDIAHFLDNLKQEVTTYQVPVVDLIAVQTKDPYKVLTATILSARTRDEVTAAAAERLFRKAPDVATLDRLSEAEISALIRPVGFFNNKASYLKALPGALAEKFDGMIPRLVDELVTLPGVGRKTANLVSAVAFGEPAICVDTHVHRIMNIWGYVATKTPLETEMALRKKLPAQYWIMVNGVLVAFGQGTCKPVRPHCDRCVLKNECPQIGIIPRKVPGATRSPAFVQPLKLVSWNVNGLRAVEKKGFLDLVNDFDADLLALQEIKAQPEQLSDALLEIPGYTAYWLPAERKGYSGVCTYSRVTPLSVTKGLGNDDFDREGRVLCLEFADFYCINAYFPNAQHGLARLDFKLAFDKALQAYCEKLAEDKTVVITGDFNVAHRAIDLTNPESNGGNPGFTPEERAWMDRFQAAGFVDTFRIFYPDEPGHYSWWSYRFNARARNIGWRIDYFWVDQKSRSRVVSAGIRSDIMGSDHCPVELVLKGKL
ncbi:MAG: exodeoxyribonuclease III [Proteobacteria bacterium]|nr:exodeoxyribonuclease III [Pseudomonadota bacterium]MBU1687594.1 exodeoxyribonuclease III [Pseudomonadota bacterium]